VGSINIDSEPLAVKTKGLGNMRLSSLSFVIRLRQFSLGKSTRPFAPKF